MLLPLYLKPTDWDVKARGGDIPAPCLRRHGRREDKDLYIVTCSSSFRSWRKIQLLSQPFHYRLAVLLFIRGTGSD